MKNEQKKKFILKLCVLVLCFYFVGGTDWALWLFPSAQEKKFESAIENSINTSSKNYFIETYAPTADRVCISGNDSSSKPEMTDAMIMEWLGVSASELKNVPQYLYGPDDIDWVPRPVIRLVVVFIKNDKIVESFVSRSPSVFVKDVNTGEFHSHPLFTIGKRCVDVKSFYPVVKKGSLHTMAIIDIEERK